MENTGFSLSFPFCWPLLSVALTLYIPKLTGQAVDYIVSEGQVDFPAVFRAMMLQIGVCTLVTALAQWLMNVCNNKMTYQVVRDIRNEAFRKIEILPLKYIDGHPCGRCGQPCNCGCGSVCRWPSDGIYPVFYRSGYDCGNIRIYAVQSTWVSPLSWF